MIDMCAQRALDNRNTSMVSGALVGSNTKTREFAAKYFNTLSLVGVDSLGPIPKNYTPQDWFEAHSEAVIVCRRFRAAGIEDQLPRRSQLIAQQLPLVIRARCLTESLLAVKFPAVVHIVNGFVVLRGNWITL